MPTSSRHDELDMFAGTVNYMMDEVERLMSEVKGSTDTIAHDLRTPLTRARAQLHRLRQAPSIDPEEIARVTAEIDEVLERFRALLRISELEARERHASFAPADLTGIVDQVVDLYQPLAEAKGVKLSAGERRRVTVEADPKLLFEAVSNLVDNAIKFTGEGGAVEVRLGHDPARPEIIVQDNGPGIPAGERTAVLQRFYRGERHRLTSGSGLGLSIVTAIMRLHGFELVLRDAHPGLEAVIACRTQELAF
jgi:signal transduction histidine kinase